MKKTNAIDWILTAITAVCFVLTCINCVSAGERESVLIPFANEEPGASDIKLYSTTPMSSGASLADYLVETHGCPQWVADYYRNDVKLLVRIHRGYTLKSFHDTYSEEQQKLAKLESPFGNSDFRYYARLREKYGKFKMLRVTEPR